MTAGKLPEGRYGPRRSGRRPRWRRSRWGPVLGMTLAGLAGLAVAVIGYRNLADVPVRGEALGFELVDSAPGSAADSAASNISEPNAVSLRFEVVRDNPERPAVCIVRARSRDGEETGRKEVYVPPAAGPVGLTTVIRTTRPPVTADVFGCSLQVPGYLLPGSAS